MVAIVSGFRAGLELSSRAVLGQAGTTGNPSEGTNGQSVFVNVGTGSLVVQNQDDYLAARGADHAVLRTYNSSGALDDDNGDQWRADQLTLKLQGTLNTIGSTLVRYDRDGSAAVYAYDSARGLYQSAEGAGAYDTISYVAAANQFEYRDGTSGITERFEGGGAFRILSRKDTSGNTLTYGYDASGLLRYVTTPTNETFHYDYAGSNLTQVRLVSGATTTTRVRYAYDTSNRLSSVTVDLTPTDNSVADGKTYETRYTYDGTSKRVASITQTDGSSLGISYVDVGGGNYKVASIRDALNQVTTFAYGAGYATVTDALNLTTRYEFDAANQLLRILPPAVAGASATRQFAYSGSGDVVRVTDGEGRSIVFEYDAQGNQVLQRDALGNTVKRTFDGRNQMLTETAYLVPDPDAGGTAQAASPLTTRYVYDASGRNLLRFVVSPQGNVTEHRYNGFGDRTSTITYAGGSYPVAGLAEQAALSEADLVAWGGAQNLAATQRVDFVYDGRQQLQTRTTYATVSSTGDGIAGLSVEYFTYDSNGRLLQTISPGNGSTTYAYDGLDRRLTSTDALGRTTVTTYDAANRVLTRTVDPGGLGLKTTYVYDAKGQRVSVTDPNQVVTTIEYDLKGRVWKQTVDPTGLKLQTIYTYDGRDNALTVTSPGGTVTRYVYDALGRRKQEIVDPGRLNLVRSWDSDKKGNVVSSTDANGNVTKFVYDAADRRVYTVNALGEVRQEAYDAAGRLTKVTAFAKRIAPGALGTSPTVLQVQSLVATDATDAVQHSVYDKDGRLAATVDGAGGVTRFTYDANGNVTARVAYANRINLAAWVPGTLPTVAADDARDQRVTTLYDALNRVSYVVDGTRGLVAFKYDGNGNVLERMAFAKAVPEGVALMETAILAALPAMANAETDAVERNTYDAANRMVTTTDGTRAVQKRIYFGQNLVQVIAHWTPLAVGGDPATVPSSERDRVTSHAYDKANRLTLTVDATKAVVERVHDAEGQVVCEIAYATPIGALPSTMQSATAEASVRALLQADAARDRSTRRAFDAAGREVLTIGAEGAVVEKVYDGAGQVVKRILYAKLVDASALPSRTSTDSLRALIQVDASLDRSTGYARDAAGRLAYEVDALNRVSRNRYDGVGRLLETRRFDQDLPVTTAVSVAALDAAMVEGANDRWEKHGYDAAGNRLRTTDALNSVESWTYDGLGNQLTFVNKKGAVWTYVRDAVGRLVKETSPVVDLATSAFDALNLKLTSTSSAAVQVITVMRYDALGNLVERVEAEGRPERRSTRYEYDAAGRQVRVLFPPVGVYDAAGDSNLSMELGVHARADTALKTLETRTYYDALGNAVANRDVGGALTQKAYDLAGRVVYEIDALGYVTGYTYNGFGNTVTLTRYASKTSLATRSVATASQAVSQAEVAAALAAPGFNHVGDRTVTRTYDRLGRVVETRQPQELVFDATVSPQSFVASAQTRNGYNAFGELVQVSKARDATGASWYSTTHYFDLLGRERAAVDAAGYLTTREYDRFGNLLQVKEYATPLPGASWTPASYGNVPAAVDEDRTTTYAYDALDRKVKETRVRVQYSNASDGTSLWGDLVTTYGYDRAQQLVKQTNTRNQSLQYGYDTAGQVVQITDSALGQVSTYVHDAAGRRIRERVVQQGTTYQDNHLAYDAIGNLRRVSDARADVNMEYDRVGNRTFVGNYVIYTGLKGVTSESGANRHFQYDKMNRQTVVDAYSRAGDIGPGQGHVITYDRNGNRKTDTAYRVTVRSTTGASPIRYFNFDTDGTAVQDLSLSYEKGNFLSKEEYHYDGANRLWSIVRDGVQVDHRRYDAADRLLFSGPATLPPNYRWAAQSGVSPGGSDGLEQKYNRYDKNGRMLHQDIVNSDGSARAQVSWDPTENLGLVAPGYDEVGNSKGYVVRDSKSGAVTRYATFFKRFEGHQADYTSGTSSVMDPGVIRQGYDANGYLVSVSDSTNSAADRIFVNDSAGRALYVNQGGSVQRQLIANGEVLGIYGVTNGAGLVDFDFSYAPITGSYPNASPGTYVLRTGDTLQSIAQSAYGDSALWYRIAEANGVMTNNDLKVGQTLNIPNRVSTIHNNDSTFKPYDPSRITGELTPNLPAPEKGCGGAGQVLMVIVAIVVSCLMPTMIGAMLGSIASQTVGLATETIDKFSWTQVGLAGISYAVSSFIPQGAFSTLGEAAGAAARAAVANAATQGIAVAGGLQPKFDWRGVAGSALGAGVAAAAGRDLGLPSNGTRPPNMTWTEYVAKTSTKAFLGGATTAAVRGGRIAVQQVAIDAFGNSLGQAIAEAAKPQGNSIYSLSSGDNGVGLRAGGSGAGLSYGGRRATETAEGYGQQGQSTTTPWLDAGAVAALRENLGLQADSPDQGWVLAAGPSNGRSLGGYGPALPIAKRPLTQKSVDGADSSSAVLGATAGVAASFGKMALGAARVGSNLIMQTGDLLTGGLNHDHPVMQQVWAEQRALGAGVLNLLGNPVGAATDLIEGVVNRYDAALAQPTDFGRSYQLGGLFNDLGQGAIGSGLLIRGAARLGAVGLEYVGENAFSGPVTGGRSAQIGAINLRGLDAATRARILERFRSGNEFEAQARAAMDVSKNFDRVYGSGDLSGKFAVPDSMRAGIVEFKDVRELSKDLQFQLYEQSQKRIELVISPRTEYISGPLIESVRASGGSISVFNPRTRLFHWYDFDAGVFLIKGAK